MARTHERDTPQDPRRRDDHRRRRRSGAHRLAPVRPAPPPDPRATGGDLPARAAGAPVRTGRRDEGRAPAATALLPAATVRRRVPRRAWWRAADRESDHRPGAPRQWRRRLSLEWQPAGAAALRPTAPRTLPGLAGELQATGGTGCPGAA